MLADVLPTWATVVVIVIGLAALGVLAFLIVKADRWFGAAADRARVRAFEGLPVSQAPGLGLVEVVFHTYAGLLVHTTQVEHHFWANPEDARIILSRLNRFNLTWGLLSRYLLVIPLLSIGNYWAQCNSISKQINSGHHT